MKELAVLWMRYHGTMTQHIGGPTPAERESERAAIEREFSKFGGDQVAAAYAQWFEGGQMTRIPPLNRVEPQKMQLQPRLARPREY
jgi:hypothetical protein